MFHRVTLIGRVGRDPEMRYTPDGTPVTDFSVATTKTISKSTRETCPKGWKESYNGKNWELTIWWRVTCWRGLAETVNRFLSKGRQVYVEGEIGGQAGLIKEGQQDVKVWTGNDGVSRASYEITADNVKFLGSPGDGDSGDPDSEAPFDPDSEEMLPF